MPLPQETAVPAEIALETSLESAVLPEPEPVTASDLERPFVQVASGSSRDNADTLVKKLVAVGLSASVRETTKDGKALFYVVVGPASNQAELDANLAKIRELGFPEAFIAKG